ncbi:hypothetical protein [Helicobacter pylori]|uniref:hypothetical protein n=1 Tax=Helicobacter pylori TaxID=210 RepID=UPI001482302C|nr:hypothetical protein [Helicobacter pylori]WJX98059.1 hypothetical protein QU610_01730 [Helicobacter pylori]
MRHSLTITETASTIASQTLMRIILPQTSLKQEPQRTKHANTRTHENFSQVKETNRF